MSALEHSGSADKPQQGNEQNYQAQLNPEHYQTGRDSRSNHNDALEVIASTVNGKERPVETVAANALALFENIERRKEPISAAGLKNLANMMACNSDVLGANGLSEKQSAIPAAARERMGAILTLQAENHPAPGAKAAINAVREMYFS
ncbi:hypothetical protein KA344_15835 [bacterium]|jgi:hypothetical protein|nr:hypothetical protein [bacterium]